MSLFGVFLDIKFEEKGKIQVHRKTKEFGLLAKIGAFHQVVIQMK